MKKILSFVLPVFFLFVVFQGAIAKNEEVHFFYSDICPHCTDAEVFLEKMTEKYPDLEINRYEVSSNIKNTNLLREMGRELKINVSGVPVFIMGEDSVIGFQNEQSTGVKIENIIKKYFGEPIEKTENSEIIKIPFFGEKNIKDFSLPVLTVVIGILDGFNPCAMWVLLFLISLLLGMHNRKKMWILGGTFILVSGIVYFLFLSLWLNLFLFIGYITYIRYAIALVALGSGIYHIREYFINKAGTCKVTKGEKQQKIFTKLKEIVSSDKFLFSLFGIVLLAVAVNLVELACSAGLPAIYTQVLALSDLSVFQYYGYLLLYILFFMLDDLFVFFLAMTTLKMAFINAKYTRYSNMIGGILMLIIGILLILRPEWLMFS